MDRVVIIGAGQAGCSAAFALRKEGFKGEVVLLGAEPDPPYQRPPLSKAYLLGDMARERLYLRPEAAYADANIELVTDTAVISIDPATMSVVTPDRTLQADAIILATGSSPIYLPDAVTHGLAGLHCVRTLADIDRLKADIETASDVLIIGGGYIGLEGAAVAAKLGKTVSVVEMSERVLQRVAAPQTSDAFRALHQQHGVTLLEGTGLTQFAGEGRVQAARLSNGENIPCDLAIVGIGIRPKTALADAAGLALENGIQTDVYGETSAKGIWAVGDCASFPLGAGRIRLESVPHAIDHAETVAANIMGKQKPYVAKPWFWSDQYDVKLQIAGLNAGYDRVVVRPGDKPGSVSHWYFASGRLISVDAMNAPRDYMAGKRWIETGVSPNPDLLADPATPIKTLG